MNKPWKVYQAEVDEWPSESIVFCCPCIKTYLVCPSRGVACLLVAFWRVKYMLHIFCTFQYTVQGSFSDIQYLVYLLPTQKFVKTQKYCGPFCNIRIYWCLYWMKTLIARLTVTIRKVVSPNKGSFSKILKWVYSN